jgi:predicted DNA-binding transcriptional regulator YafY
VDSSTLATIAAACRDHHRLRFDYRRHDGTEIVRTVEPHRMVHTGRRWYLVAWDTDRRDWRTFRVDRIRPRIPTGPRFTPREPPDADLGAFVRRGVDTALFRYRAQVTVYAPAQAITRRVPDAVAVEAVDEQTCRVHAGADTPALLAIHILMLDADFEVDGPPELVEALRRVAERCGAAVRLRRRGSAPSTRR